MTRLFLHGDSNRPFSLLSNNAKARFLLKAVCFAMSLYILYFLSSFYNVLEKNEEASFERVSSSKVNSVVYNGSGLNSTKENSVVYNDSTLNSTKDNRIVYNDPGVNLTKENSVVYNNSAMSSTKDNSAVDSDSAVVNSTNENSVIYNHPGVNSTKDSVVVHNSPNWKTLNADERFILVIGIGEQETKAQLHMRSISFFSALVNRTIVLPNVSGSRLGACRRYPFRSYYAADEWLAENEGQFRHITHQDFFNWLNKQERLGHRPTGQRVRMGFNTNIPETKHINNCYLKWGERFNLSGKYAEPLVLDMAEVMPDLVETVVDFVSKIDAQVILLRFGPADHWFPNPNTRKAIPYSRQLEDQALAILDFVKPSLAMHWRMETVPLKNIPGCAERLVEHVHALKTRGNMNFEHIYFMTDYPLVEGQFRSATFRSLKKEHLNAIEYLKMQLNLTSAFYNDGKGNPPENVTYPATGTHMTFLGVSPSNGWIDGGQLGIVEKMVAENARYFSAGIYNVSKPLACGRSSSYVKAIVSERRRSIVAERHLPISQRRLANGVDYWGA